LLGYAPESCAMEAIPSDGGPDPNYSDDIVQTVREPLLVLDAGLRVKQASRSFYRTFKVTPQETYGRSLYELGDGQWNIPALRKLLHEILLNNSEFDDYKVEHAFTSIGRRTMLLNARRLSGDKAGLILLAIEDVTERRDTEVEVARQRQWLATALASIGDAVIATDTDARVTFMNPTAERLTAWDQKQAIGRPLHEIFNIINEDTRNTVESPVSKAIRMGSIVGLANHTVLIAKDGTERPIDDSAAPIRDEAGNVLGVVMVFHDITDRRAAERTKARLAEIVESSEDAIVAKDLNGVITAWNPGAEHLFGYAAEEAIGKSITIIIPSDRQKEEADVLRRIRRGERIEHFETMRRRKDGSLVEISLSVSPLKNRRGEIIGASKTARDITERKRLHAALEAHLINEQSLRMEAESANRSKDLFLATLSHELRTPLSAIVGWVSILRAGGCKEEDLREGLEVIDRNAKAQVQLIDDVLDVSRIVSGKLQLNVRRCEFGEVISAALDSVRPAADAKGIHIETQIDPSAGPGTCDPARIQQVVWNLLTNAIKFTPKGGRVTIALDREHSVTRVTVADTGLGISPTFLPHVFDRFRQADSSTRRKFGGLGLGLSIVKQLVEMHGGIARAESAGEGRGAKFTIELPIAAVSAAQVEESAVGADEQKITSNIQGEPQIIRLDGLRIVAVDDEADARRILTKLLSEAGAIVTAAANVPEALQAVEKVKPHVLVSDLGMPDEDGYDLIRKIRANGLDAKSLPAVALTAFAHKSYARNALMAGFQVHVPKPVDPRDLLVVIASLAGRTG
jgi:PAS domain S-box-containing protein